MLDAMSALDVTICIPAWEAEPFIERTLGCARRQTHEGVRILISVDRSEDATAELCRSHARDDRRIEVFVHGERLGWAENVNFLLDRVDTEFYFLYFHDDLIAPSYAERLLSVLRARPDAASVHCDMGHFGGSDHVSVGREYQGSAAERLIAYLHASAKGSPLRSLTRSDLLGRGLRMPIDAEGGFWANQPFLMRLLAGGAALHVPEVLYRRWDRRTGGLTDGWTRFTLEQVVSGFRANTRTCFALLDAVPATPIERELLTFGLYLYMVSQLRLAEDSLGAKTRLPAAALHPAFAGQCPPGSLSLLNAELAQSGRATAAWLSRFEGAAS